MLKTSWKVLGFLSFPFSFSPFFFIFSKSFSSLHFSFPLIHQESFLPPMTRYPLELLFKSRKVSLPYLHCFSSLPFLSLLLLLDFFTLLSRCFPLSPIHPVSLSRNPLSHPPPLLDLAPKQFNQSPSLFHVRPIGLSPAEAFLLFAHELAASSSWASCYSGNLNNPVHKPR